MNKIAIYGSDQLKVLYVNSFTPVERCTNWFYEVFKSCSQLEKFYYVEKNEKTLQRSLISILMQKQKENVNLLEILKLEKMTTLILHCKTANLSRFEFPNLVKLKCSFLILKNNLKVLPLQSLEKLSLFLPKYEFMLCLLLEKLSSLTSLSIICTQNLEEKYHLPNHLFLNLQTLKINEMCSVENLILMPNLQCLKIKKVNSSLELKQILTIATLRKLTVKVSFINFYEEFSVVFSNLKYLAYNVDRRTGTLWCIDCHRKNSFSELEYLKINVTSFFSIKHYFALANLSELHIYTNHKNFYCFDIINFTSTIKLENNNKLHTLSLDSSPSIDTLLKILNHYRVLKKLQIGFPHNYKKTTNYKTKLKKVELCRMLNLLESVIFLGVLLVNEKNQFFKMISKLYLVDFIMWDSYCLSNLKKRNLNDSIKNNYDISDEFFVARTVQCFLRNKKFINSVFKINKKSCLKYVQLRNLNCLNIQCDCPICIEN